MGDIATGERNGETDPSGNEVGGENDGQAKNEDTTSAGGDVAVARIGERGKNVTSSGGLEAE